MGKQEKMFDDLEGTALRGRPLKIEDVNPFDLPSKMLEIDSNDFSVTEQSIKAHKKEISVFKGSSVGRSEVTPIESVANMLPKSIPAIKQVILGNVPSKSNCYRIITFRSKDESKKQGHASLAKTPELKKYENDFYLQAHKFRNLNIDELFEFEIDVYYPTQRSDLDNSLKVVLDCMQVINAIKNDNKCTRIVANKFLDKNNPRIEFILKKSM